MARPIKVHKRYWWMTISEGFLTRSLVVFAMALVCVNLYVIFQLNSIGSKIALYETQMKELSYEMSDIQTEIYAVTNDLTNRQYPIASQLGLAEVDSFSTLYMQLPEKTLVMR